MSSILIPLVTCEDIRLALNGTYNSGANTYTFWGQAINSGSILAQINLANYYLYGILGAGFISIPPTTEIEYHLKACELDYSCMRIIVLLSGDVIVDGFNWAAGASIQQPALLPTYRMLISEFKESAQLHLRAIQPIAVSMNSEVTQYRNTCPSVF